MRSVPVLCALLLALAAPAALASVSLPDDWAARGEALWANACLGELSAGAIGPMLVGEHAGDWWFWMDVTAREGNCASVHREGWIVSPYSRHPQILQSDASGGSMVTFSQTQTGERALELYEWRTVDHAPVDALEIDTLLQESSLL